MRVWYIAAAALVAFGFGCNKSPEGGTPGTNASFKIALPGLSGSPLAKDVKQGDRESYDASIDRGSDFKKDVKLTVASKPEKIDVKLNKESIKAGEGDTKFTITVAPAKDAAIGEHEIKISAAPADGGKATEGTFKVKVIENK
ncbi:Uncharacterized protein OS=Singulisphaera acidiphila (strain ATCC BAA-1392 / DSM 18658 / VKM B-2454 / MOB10) GN=Sinac_1997 PE=4 SV=1 [Gemmata massiliana]|uniref:Uncharacterized protein n=1 Tax=Gemmata massiliana TaxID=1210884 RepID=A0A6P2D6A2_9BACT|nr:hypothetical protein [Gemmata massiliana]VTR95985.1 Uncharacterized protein OS=Singulisphaera acidiphila (strain ATCC BAA-1392 / DSM 18658 / VKM B-2454 / MOB10) GN=Sinac_1997 PE=4 SV=1 [Gemmata massiliana]